MSPGAVPPPHPLLQLQREEACRLALRVYWRRLSRQVVAAGLDPEDGAQEAVAGVLVRLGSWAPGGGAPVEWWIARSVVCAVGNWITASRRGRRVPAGGLSSLATEAGTEIEIEGGAWTLSREQLREVLDGLDTEALVEVSRAIGGRR